MIGISDENRENEEMNNVVINMTLDGMCTVFQCIGLNFIHVQLLNKLLI